MVPSAQECVCQTARELRDHAHGHPLAGPRRGSEHRRNAEGGARIDGRLRHRVVLHRRRGRRQRDVSRTKADRRGGGTDMVLRMSRRLFAGSALVVGLAVAATPAAAQRKYDDGASDTEIRIGHTNPYSGPASAFGVLGKTIEAYFKMVNDKGGINGRKIAFISYDDGYNPAKTVEMAKKLVEEDKVLLLFQTLGTPSNVAIQKYLNQKQVPQLFVASGASRWSNPKEYPWTMGWQPDYVTEAAMYAQDALTLGKDAKIAVLMQNDEYGKDYLNGFKAALGKDADRIVRVATYEVTDQSVESQIVELKESGANVFFNIATPKFAAQAIKKSAEIGWKPLHYLNAV